jgi:hypothetical protein
MTWIFGYGSIVYKPGFEYKRKVGPHWQSTAGAQQQQQQQQQQQVCGPSTADNLP